MSNLWNPMKLRDKFDAIEKEYSDLALDYEDKLKAKDEEIKKIELWASVGAFVQNNPVFAQAAMESGLSLQDWVIRVLVDAADADKQELPIRGRIMDRLKQLAEFRGVSIAAIGRGEGCTDWLNQGLDNRRF